MPHVVAVETFDVALVLAAAGTTSIALARHVVATTASLAVVVPFAAPSSSVTPIGTVDAAALAVYDESPSLLFYRACHSV